MKTRIAHLIMILSVMFIHPLFAQPPREEGLEHRPPGPRDREDAPRRGERPESPVRQFMQELREQNPEEFERLQKLRHEDPEAFRNHLQTNLYTRMMDQLQAERPDIHKVVSQMSADDFAWLVRKIGSLRPPPEPGAMSRGPEMSDEARPERNIRRMVRDYRQEQDPAKKSALREELRGMLEQEYDQRIEGRNAQVEQMEAKVRHLRETLREGEEEKQRFIEEKLSTWLDQ